MAGSGSENSVIFATNADFSGSSNVSINNGLTADNQVWLGRSATVGSLSQIDVMTLTAGSGISLTRAGAGSPGSPGTLTIANTGSMTDLHDTRFIVSAGGSADGANYTTIASALTAAAAAGGVQDIFIQPGTYTENLTLPANINLVAHVADAFTPTVTITGKITCSDAGSRSISGIRLKTNSDFCLVVSGSVATVVNLVDCFIEASNNTAISYTSSSSSSELNLMRCNGNLSTTGIAYFSSSGSGFTNVNFCRFTNTGSSTTANTFSAGDAQFRASYFNTPFTFSTSAGCDFNNCVIFTFATNTTCLTINSTSGNGNNCFFSRFDSGTASSVSIGASATCTIYQSILNSSNTNVITGSGTLSFSDLSFNGSSSTINPTTQTALFTNLGKYRATGQSSFCSYLNTSVTNVTGDGTTYTVIFDTEKFDQNSDYNTSTGVFTAPATGRYLFTVCLALDTTTTGATANNIRLVTSGETWRFTNPVPAGIQQGGCMLSHSLVVPMTAGDTASVTWVIAGLTKVFGLSGKATVGQIVTTFTGQQIA